MEQGRCHWCSDGSLSLLETYNLPFAVALMLLAIIAIAQVVGVADMFDGADVDVDLDLDVDVDADGIEAIASGGLMDGLLSLLGFGRVPFLIWLAGLLLVFASIGVIGQSVIAGLLGAPLPAWLAATLAGLAALPVNAAFVRPVGALLPKDETSAVGRSSLIRRDAIIQTGTARAGSPARAKVLDRFKQPHFVMVEPHDPNAELREGETVLLVRREEGTFFAIRYENRLLELN